MARKLPFDDVESWFEQMSRQFEAAAQRWGSGFEPWSPEMESPPIDVVDADDEFVVAVDLPGFTADDVDVHITDRTLAIEAERDRESEASEGNYVRRERSHRSLSRRVRLPGDVDGDDVSASMDDGVLTVHIGKAHPSSSGRQIDIE